MAQQALIVLACNLLRVLFALIKGKQVWDPIKVLGTYRLERLGLVA